MLTGHARRIGRRLGSRVRWAIRKGGVDENFVCVFVDAWEMNPNVQARVVRQESPSVQSYASRRFSPLPFRRALSLNAQSREA
jgi:hypothetical protein